MLNLGFNLSPVPQLILTNDHHYEMLALIYNTPFQLKTVL